MLFSYIILLNTCLIRILDIVLSSQAMQVNL